MINYLNLHDSSVYFESVGFKRVESPWTVTQAVSKITKPKGKSDFELEKKQKVLVASGEQSFLYLYLKDFLPKGSFQTITPCFRDESFDLTHSKYFMKNELIDTLTVTKARLDEIISLCQLFFEEKLRVKVDVVGVRNGPEDGPEYDIEYKGIELGSYGIRSCNYLEWIYATGCAEPRLSYVKNLIDNGRLS